MITPESVASTAFPGPDPVNLLLRRAIQEIADATRSASAAEREMEEAMGRVWEDAKSLGSAEQDPASESRLIAAGSSYRRAAGCCEAAAEDLRGARVETVLRRLEELSRERAFGDRA